MWNFGISKIFKAMIFINELIPMCKLAQKSLIYLMANKEFQVIEEIKNKNSNLPQWSHFGCSKKEGEKNIMLIIQGIRYTFTQTSQPHHTNLTIIQQKMWVENKFWRLTLEVRNSAVRGKRCRFSLQELILALVNVNNEGF